MTISEVLKIHLSAEVGLLLSHVLGKPKEFLYMEPEYQMSENQKIRLQKAIKRRQKGEPIAYILGYKDFMGLRFKVNKNVLIPRPETEALVELAFNRIKNYELRIKGKDISILDVGTGSGCIIISLFKQMAPIKGQSLDGRHQGNGKMEFYASDISLSTLGVAKENAKKHHAKIKFIKSDLLKNIEFQPNIIIANLPYGWKEWENNTTSATEGLKFEPREALFTKDYGLHEICRLLKQVSRLPHLPEVVYLEFDPRQKNRLNFLIKKYLPNAGVKFYKDFNCLWRFAEIKT